MSAYASDVNQAQKWAQFLEENELKRTGNRLMARERLESRYRLRAGVFYALRYRPWKLIPTDIYRALQEAMIAECEKAKAALEHEITLARAAGLDVDHPAMRRAEIASGSAAEGGQV